MKIGIARESYPGEKRVAITPDIAVKLIAMGFTVAIEAGAGVGSDYADDTYLEAGVVLQNADVLWSTSDLILKVRSPVASEVERMRSGSWLISFIWPAQQPELMQQFASQKATMIPIACVLLR